MSNNQRNPKTGRFLTGNSGGGRPQGTRSKLGEAFLAELFEDWQANGKDVIEKVRQEKPDVYLKTIASILPRENNVTIDPCAEMSDEQLIKRLRELDEEIRPLLDLELVGDGDDTSH